MPKIVPGGYKEAIINQDDKRPWWEKYESNAEKREREQTQALLVSDHDLKFLKQFGNVNVSIAGLWAINKILKK